jgi:hypothetical protein
MSDDDTIVSGEYQIWRLNEESGRNDDYIISPNPAERGDFKLTKVVQQIDN